MEQEELKQFIYKHPSINYNQEYESEKIYSEEDQNKKNIEYDMIRKAQETII